VWVKGSRRYQPADRYLIAPAAWPARRDAARRILGLPASVDERVEQQPHPAHQPPSFGFHSAAPLIALVYLCCGRIVIDLPR
jgi:hypothetical protein